MLGAPSRTSSALSIYLLLLLALLVYTCGSRGLPTAQGEVVTVSFSITGIGEDVSLDATVLTVDGVDYRVADLPVSFNWSPGSVHSYQWVDHVSSITGGKRYAWRSTSGIATGMGGILYAPESSGTVLAEYKVQYLWVFNAEGLGPDIAFPLAPLSVDGAFIDVDLLPYSFWWDEGSQHACCFEEFVHSTSGYRRYANHDAGCINLTVTGPGTLSRSYHVEYLVHVGVGRGNGTTNPPPGEYWVDDGTYMRLTAIPGQGYVFEEWTDIYAECSTYDRHSNPTELFVCGQVSLRANFREVKPFDFNVKVEPSSIQVYRGGSAIVGVVVLGEGEPVQAVSLMVLNTPKGVSYTLGTELVVPPTSTTLIVTVSQEARAGAYTVVLVATSGNITKEYPITLNILEHEEPWYKQPQVLVTMGTAVTVLIVVLVLTRLRRSH
ncbi:MAG: hypothetical protein QXO87_00970 [Desulfurococcaceae archaeon]